MADSKNNDRPLAPGVPAPKKPTQKEPTKPVGPLPPKPDQQGPDTRTPTGAATGTDPKLVAQQGSFLTTAHGARLRDSDHTLRAGLAVRPCCRIITCGRRSVTSTTSGSRSEWCTRAARQPTGSLSATVRRAASAELPSWARESRRRSSFASQPCWGRGDQPIWPATPAGSRLASTPSMATTTWSATTSRSSSSRTASSSPTSSTPVSRIRTGRFPRRKVRTTRSGTSCRCTRKRRPTRSGTCPTAVCRVRTGRWRASASIPSGC